jgi:hypothetical protein
MLVILLIKAVLSLLAVAVGFCSAMRHFIASTFRSV